MLAPPRIDPASFRDPIGRVQHSDGAVYRVLSNQGRAWLSQVWDSGIVTRLIESGFLIETLRLADSEAAQHLRSSEGIAVLQHERLPLVSYPYEWTFAGLKTAALLHLDFHLALLNENFTLSDATAFNVQFRGPRPVYIDVLSIAPYRDGEPFAGYGQFQRQFLNPLILEAECGMSPNAAWRGSLDGLSSEDIWGILPLRKKLKPAYWTHVGLTARYDARVASSAAAPTPAPPSLPKARLIALLKHLRIVIEGLAPKPVRQSVWADYANDCSYSQAETTAKLSAVAAFCQTVQPRCLLDVGCNTGVHAAHALANGAASAVGIEGDHGAAEIAFTRATKERLNFLPLNVDFANPSPSQGWANVERPGLFERLRADALLALAVIHHLCIGRNIPLADAVSTLVKLAPRGLIEFVPKQDPQVQRLLRHRPDVRADYSIENFRAALAAHGRTVKETQITSSGRRIFEYAAG